MTVFRLAALAAGLIALIVFIAQAALAQWATLKPDCGSARCQMHAPGGNRP